MNKYKTLLLPHKYYGLNKESSGQSITFRISEYSFIRRNLFFIQQY